MTRGVRRSEPRRPLRDALTEPRWGAALLMLGAVAATVASTVVPCWAVVGALAGFSLSGSV